MPHLALGLLLVIACATGFAIVSTQLDDRVAVLALIEPVTVGQVLEPSHLREVDVAVAPDVDVIPSSHAASVVGTPVAVSLPAGTVLSPAMLGDASLPEPDSAVVAVALAPGAFPPEASQGSAVVVVPAAPATETTSDPARGWAAVVVGVHPTETEATTVISLQVAEADARRIAAAGPVSVVMTPAGGD
ncbi:hypothetical protein [Jiangella muralis]|uniref:hypothetical protein n=1 Tax=Jiangella muralis TaxID=702383 RepID=UPI001969DD16|nr:hypothetical protein [Jiangella muralis]